MWIKICGVRDTATALDIAALQPQAIGLNFCPTSRRCISRETAAEIVRKLPPTVAPVAVVVNATLDELRRIHDETGVRMVQLHGDESPEFTAALTEALPDVQVIIAQRVRGAELGSLSARLEALRALGVRPAACLLDAFVEGSYGGTGAVVPWDATREGYRGEEWPPLVLAGGLRPENVAEAIQRVRPWGVDVASGVEGAPGEKDPARVAAFLSAARGAFQELERAAEACPPSDRLKQQQMG